MAVHKLIMKQLWFAIPSTNQLFEMVITSSISLYKHASNFSEMCLVQVSQKVLFFTLVKDPVDDTTSLFGCMLTYCIN